MLNSVGIDLKGINHLSSPRVCLKSSASSVSLLRIMQKLAM